MNDFNSNTDLSNDYTENNYKKDNASSKMKNNQLISLGKCSKFYLYILGSAGFKSLSLILLGNKDKNKGFFPHILSSNQSMKSIYTYLSFIMFGIILYFYSRNNKSNTKNVTTFCIHEKILKQNNENSKIFIFLTCFCFAFYKEIQKILDTLGFTDLDFWAFEILFTFLFMRRYFEFDIYKHHICSIITISIISLILQIIYMFLPDTNGKNFSQRNEERSISNWYIIIFLLICILLSISYAFSHNYSKVLMQAKFISHYTLIIFIGITGLVLSLIISSITIFTNYSELNSFNFTNYFKDLKSSNISDIVKEILIVLPLYLIFQFMQLNFEILTIYYLTPMHCLLLNNITYSIQKLIMFLLGYDWEIKQFLISELTEIISIFGFIIYLEILELNFCGLSDNLRRKIIAKGDREFRKLNADNMKNKAILDENEEEDESSDIGIGKLEEMVEKRKKSVIVE